MSMSLNNPMKNKTPEERKEIARKSHETRKLNKEQKERGRSELHGVLSDIDEKREYLRKINVCHELQSKSQSMTGKYLLTEESIVENSEVFSKLTGVYFLVRKGRVHYVGQSVNIMSRINTHNILGDYDGFAWVECEKQNLDALESLYIHFLRPEGNGTRGCGGKYAPLKLDDIIGSRGSVSE